MDGWMVVARAAGVGDIPLSLWSTEVEANISANRTDMRAVRIAARDVMGLEPNVDSVTVGLVPFRFAIPTPFLPVKEIVRP